MRMSVSLSQFRAALGSHAEGLSDADLQKRLDYMYRFADSFYDWWYERKGGASECITGAYVSDVYDDTERSIEKIKATEPHVYLLTPEREVREGLKQIAKEQYENERKRK